MKANQVNRWAGITAVLVFGTALAAAVCCKDASRGCGTPTLNGNCGNCGAAVNCIPEYEPSYRDVAETETGGNADRIGTYTCEWNCSTYCDNCYQQVNFHEAGSPKEEFRATGHCPGGL